MKAVLVDPSIARLDTGAPAVPIRAKMLVLLEVCAVFAVIMISLVAHRSTAVYRWEVEHLGWTYTGMAIYMGIPAVVVWLTRRGWAEYGVSAENWRTNLDAGIKASLIRCLPTWLGFWGVRMLALGDRPVIATAVEVSLWIAALGLLVWVLNRQQPAASARRNVITILSLCSLPVVAALVTSQLSVVVVSTVVWQFALSGFGEEFVYRGYYQSRLNQVFGRPARLFGVQFGAGLILASLLFGLNHALNTYDPALGFSSLNWSWAAGTFAGGLFLGVLREKTGTLLAPGIAHGLLDAFGEPFIKMFGW